MIYIQSNNEGLPHHFDVACVLYGAKDLGIPYKLITFEELQSGKFDNLIKSHCFAGSVEFMREVFNRVNIKDPRVPLNSDRNHVIRTLKEIRQDVSNGVEWFVKPTQIKLFTGLVVDQLTISSLKDFDDALEVMIYDVFPSKILSEWRCYIHNNKIVDVRNYSGDLFSMIGYPFINSIINKYKDTFPIAYTIDVGVLKHDNVVIEFNDMWAIGNYGISNDLYVRMLRDRYFEIIKIGK